MTSGHPCSGPPQRADHRPARCRLRPGLQGEPVSQPGGRPAGRALGRAAVEGGQRLGLELVAVVHRLLWPWGSRTGLLVERFFVGPVRRKTKAPVRLLILTIGVSQVLLALTYIPGLDPDVAGALPPAIHVASADWGRGAERHVGADASSWCRFCWCCLWVFLEFSSIGKQIRAAAGNPDAARLCGISVNRVSLITWGIAGGSRRFAAVLNGPTTTSFNAQAAGPYLLMLTMGAAAFGAFVSFPVAVGGGIGLGLVYQVVAAETNNAGTAELAVFGVILLGDLGAGPGHRAGLRRRRGGGARAPRAQSARGAARLDAAASRDEVAARGVVAGGGGVSAAAVLQDRNQFLLGAGARLRAGRGVADDAGGLGRAGQPGPVRPGRYRRLPDRPLGRTSGWSVLDLFVVTGVVGAAVMVAIGLPALRVRGLTLAVTTLGLAVIAPDWLYLQSLGGRAPRPSPRRCRSPRSSRASGHIGSQLYLYYVVLVVLVVVVAAAATLRRSAIGRVVIAVRDNERASAAFGIKPATVKLRVLALSGFIAAHGRGLLGTRLAERDTHAVHRRHLDRASSPSR